MAKKLHSAPLFYTLAQVKFNAIIQMETYVPEIQDKLRRSGYPDFRSENQLALAIRRLDTEQPEINSQKHDRWSFSNSECTEGYLLLSNALVFHTTVYDSFADFSKKLIQGLELVHNIVGLSYVENIGLRYLNAITADPQSRIEDYINLPLLGFSTIIEGTLKHNFIEIMTEVDDGTLLARTVVIERGLALPPDLSPLQLKISSKFSNFTGKTATLDLDHFVNLRMDFDTQFVKNQLIKSHHALKKVFHASITDNARDTWG